MNSNSRTNYKVLVSFVYTFFHIIRIYPHNFLVFDYNYALVNDVIYEHRALIRIAAAGAWHSLS